MSDRDPSDELIHELKIRRYAENLTRVNAGFLGGLPTIVAIEELLRLLVHGEVDVLMVWFGAIMAIAAVVLIPVAARSPVESARRRFARMPSSSARKWLDRPYRLPKFLAVMAWALLTWLISFSIVTGDWGLSGAGPFSFIAAALVWSGLRWRAGDELVCGRCEYPKSPESGDICPECGSAWVIADTLALGRVRVVAWMIALGSAAIALDLFLVISTA